MITLLRKKNRLLGFEKEKEWKDNHRNYSIDRSQLRGKGKREKRMTRTEEESKIATLNIISVIGVEGDKI